MTINAKWGGKRLLESVSSISDAFLRPQISNNVHLINTVSAHYRILVEHQTYMTFNYNVSNLLIVQKLVKIIKNNLEFSHKNSNIQCSKPH